MKAFVQECWDMDSSFGVFTPDEIIIAQAAEEFPKHNIPFDLAHTLTFLSLYKEEERQLRHSLNDAIKTRLEKVGIKKGTTFIFSLDTGSPIEKVVNQISTGHKYPKTYAEWTKEVVCS